MIQINVNLLYTIINLVVLYLLLKKFLFKPVLGIMEKRQQIIADGLKSAEDAQAEADRLKSQYEQALSNAKEESVQIVEKARADAKAEYERIMQEAGGKAGSLVENAKKNMEIERQQTMNELQAEIAGLAMSAAEKIVAEKTGKQQNQEIYDQFLEGVGEAHEDADKDD